ncbi:MAG: D-alanyl-D-alanine carboxypeptidase [Ruminococcaceae bacterium]|nr:D-alanyl-D-alanine carboxypeptidase [Oscillospiraceae bacterium]
MKIMKNTGKILALFLCITILTCSFSISANATGGGYIATVGAPTTQCKSAVLMEAQTGKVLYELNPDEALPPASVTKIMTLLLVMEAIERGELKYDDMLQASEHACSMGGSQIYLKEGEEMSVDDLIKSVVIASANDAAVVLAEKVAGSEDAFVELMNKRAKELGMENTHFENTNGLDDTVENHLISAMDIAIMSRELIKHKKITEYSSIWMDTIRNGEFGLTNTNRLVRFYKGATGLKTGSTDKAGFCISATAERDGMTLIAVVMGSPTRDIRNTSATSMLDWGFANFALYNAPAEQLEPITVRGGKNSFCNVGTESFSTVIEKSEKGRVEAVTELPPFISAPTEQGQQIGCIRYRVGEKEIGSVGIMARENVKKISFVDVFLRIISAAFIN